MDCKIDPEFLNQLKTSACAEHWKRVGLHPHQGMILMLSSIHSKLSSGIGEFLDLIPLFKWAHSVGLDFIQLLPITDSGMDNSPYNPISTLALNPVFISLHALPHFKQNDSLCSQYEKLKKETKTKRVDYHRIRGLKFNFLREYSKLYRSRFEKLEAFKKFKKEHRWVYDYALFNAFADEHQTHQWLKWPKTKHDLTAAQKRTFHKKHDEELHFYILVQYLAFVQMKKVRSEAQKNKIFLFGDLPFLVSKHSMDAWCYPKLFLMNYSVGSPPDKLTPEGQDWEFPAYNWEELRKTNYRWWKLRLSVAEHYFHIYRLDHIIGFYRTWNIPRGKKGADGAYSPKDPSKWLDHGRSFLKTLLKFSKMLPIGEDLVIPQSIIDSMRDLGISGTRILTWQRTGAGGLDFVPPELYTVASITNLASHDTSTLSQWWKRYPKTAKEFSLWRGWKHTPYLSREKRLELLRISHHTSSLFHANLLQEYLALFPELVHKKIDEERINYPGTPSHRNWRYRFVPSVEEIIKHRKLFHAFKSVVT